MLTSYLHSLQSKVYKTQNEQLVVANTTLESEVTKLHKEVETLRSRQTAGTQVTSLQEELEKLRAELQEAHTQRKQIEEEFSNEKQGLEQVRNDAQITSWCLLMFFVSRIFSYFYIIWNGRG